MEREGSLENPGAKVELPKGMKPPFGVYVNGIEQKEGVDFRSDGKYLWFKTALVREGRLGFWRWFSMFLGIGNTYRPNDGVDVICHVRGHPVAFTALPIETLRDPERDGRLVGAHSFDPAQR